MADTTPQKESIKPGYLITAIIALAFAVKALYQTGQQNDKERLQTDRERLVECQAENAKKDSTVGAVTQENASLTKQNHRLDSVLTEYKAENRYLHEAIGTKRAIDKIKRLGNE